MMLRYCAQGVYVRAMNPYRAKDAVAISVGGKFCFTRKRGKSRNPSHSHLVRCNLPESLCGRYDARTTIKYSGKKINTGSPAHRCDKLPRSTYTASTGAESQNW